ncbi:52 kDa repressor of the inhibitor of the protein kinase-like [Ciona intestinalis]
MRSCEVREIRRALKIVSGVVTFFSSSFKRQSILQSAIRQMFSNDATITATKLTKLCNTRWVERHTAVVKFLKLYPGILQALLQVEEFLNNTVASQAETLRLQITQFPFILALNTIKLSTEILLFVTKILQKQNMDIVSACEEIGDVKRKLASLNQEDFRLIYDNAKLLAAEHRISVRASRCSVTEIENEEQIYEKMYSTMFVPFVRSLKEGMDTRFSSIIYKAAIINRLIPIYLHGTECDVGMFRAVAELYATDISQETFLLEVPRWHRRWNTEISGKQSIVDFPHDLKTTLNHCNPNLFPNIFKLLKVRPNITNPIYFPTF